MRECLTPALGEASVVVGEAGIPAFANLEWELAGSPDRPAGGRGEVASPHGDGVADEGVTVVVGQVEEQEVQVPGAVVVAQVEDLRVAQDFLKGCELLESDSVFGRYYEAQIPSACEAPS